MKTIVIKINPNKIDYRKIKIAAKAIKEGRLVAFPTETVYGLGADAFNVSAVSKIFKVKNRPLSDPLIVHIADKKDTYKLVTLVPGIVTKLVNRFWPGPLTIILKKSEIVPDIVTANLNTVAIRMPNNPVALALIRQSQTPIAAPSANIFSTPSSTTAKHVIEDLNGKIDVIIDTGKTKIGVESTVVDFSNTSHYLPKILRPGAITYEMLRKFLGRNITESETSDRREGRDGMQVYRSPGLMKKHYSPKAKLILANTVNEMIRQAQKFQADGKQVGILTFSENKGKFKGVGKGFKVKILGSKTDLKTCAKKLFSKLREFDTDGIDVIVAEKTKKAHIGRAIMDRLEKAAG